MPHKFAIVIPDGAADEPLESLGGKTPLQAAHTPEMDAIAREGVLGRSRHDPGDGASASAPVPLVMMTHLAVDAHLRTAVAEIDRLDVVRLPTVYLGVGE